jgi:hypothetical protein
MVDQTAARSSDEGMPGTLCDLGLKVGAAGHKVGTVEHGSGDSAKGT